MQYFPEFYIMRLLWLHPEALPDSIPQQVVCSQWIDGIFQSYKCRSKSSQCGHAEKADPVVHDTLKLNSYRSFTARMTMLSWL